VYTISYHVHVYKVDVTGGYGIRNQAKVPDPEAEAYANVGASTSLPTVWYS